MSFADVLPGMANLASAVTRSIFTRGRAVGWLPRALALWPLWSTTTHAQMTLKLDSAADPREGVHIAAAARAEGVRLVAGVLGDGVRLATSASVEAGRLPTAAPRAGERLSDWLLRQPADPRAYPTGLQWQVPGEHYTQGWVKRELPVLLLAEAATAAARANLARLIEALPVTGRVPVPLAEARWLQAHQKDDT